MWNCWKMGEKMIRILYEDNHVLCVAKPVNVPVNEDDSHDMDLLTMCRQYLKTKYDKPGNVYLGLVHRLDRPVGGVMVFAKTSKAASRLSESVRTHALTKEYLAVLDGSPTEPSGNLTDYLEKDHRTNMVRTTDSRHGKKSELFYEVMARKGKHTLVHVRLKTGRSHQIRVQFASRNMPLVHDQRYNRHTTRGQIALYACRLTFPHPVTKELITVTDYPPRREPWNEFEISL